MNSMLVDDYNPLDGNMLSVIDKNGKVVGVDLEPTIEPDLLTRAYKTMILARAADDRAVRLQRQGKMGAYPPSRGQEASQLGPSMALSASDWVVPGFRELTALIWKGVPLWQLYIYWMGNEAGSRFPAEVHVTPSVVPVGDQILHAVGIAYASKLRKDGSVVAVYFGDGGSSEGSFHEGLNMAGVLRTPNVFICQNNQYAISVPRSRQTSSKTIAQKAISYGFPGILVDGNDLLALYIAAKEAVERARKGDGPTLIESYTYRLGDHTTSDDATRYRKEEELREWEGKDPLRRMRLYLEAKGLWDEDKEKKAQDEAVAAVDSEVTKAQSQPDPVIDDYFQYTYGEMPPGLADQLAAAKKGGAS